MLSVVYWFARQTVNLEARVQLPPDTLLENAMENENEPLILDLNGYLEYTLEDVPIAFTTPIPMHTFTMTSADGKQANVDFCDDEVTYSGDLPFAESAKLFFDAVIAHWKSKPRCRTCDWYNNGGGHLTCNCPKMFYGYRGTQGRASDSLSVENDEGWGMVPGLDFGCVHHKEKSCLTTNQKT